MIQKVGQGNHIPGDSGLPRGSKQVKPSPQLKESIRGVETVLSDPGAGVQGSLSRRDLLSASGQLTRTDFRKVKAQVTQGSAGNKGTVKATKNAFAKAGPAFETLGSYLVG